MIEVVQAVDALSAVKEGVTYGSVWGFAYSAKNQLESLFSQSLYSGALLSSWQSGNELHTTLEGMVGQKQEDVINPLDDWLVRSQSERFKTVLLAELGTLPCYYVRPNPPYNTNSLLDSGETLMPAALVLKAPEAVFDAKQAAKALAFDLGTACGFHAFRVLESVVRRYYTEVTGGKAEPKQRNLGVYIRALTTAKADSKIIAALTQIKDLHRNPLVHPEVAILADEAISILGMVRSLVTMMLVALPEVPQTTATATA